MILPSRLSQSQFNNLKFQITETFEDCIDAEYMAVDIQATCKETGITYEATAEVHASRHHDDCLEYICDIKEIDPSK
jgi:hypothetical protein